MSKAAEECKKCTNAMAMRGGIVVVRVNTNIAVNLIGKCMNAMTIEVMMVLKVNTSITTNLLGEMQEGKENCNCLGFNWKVGEKRGHSSTCYLLRTIKSLVDVTMLHKTMSEGYM